MQETQPHARPRQAQPHRVRRSVTRGSPHVNWRRRIALIGVFLLAILLAGVALLWQRAVVFNDAVSTESALSSRLWTPLGGPEQVNVLLIGHSPEGRDGAFLADSLTVLSIDAETELTTSVSIPRDLWIEGIADLPANGKVNEAFAAGYRRGGFVEGGEQTTRVVAAITGLDIHGWIALDFQGFEEMVDAVGGVTVNNPRTFRWAMGPAHFERGEWADTFPKGQLHLSGVEALRYARVRYTDLVEESSDFARGARQQLILAAIRDRISLDPGGIPRALALSDSLVRRLHTNLSVIDLAMLASHLSADRRIQLQEGEILQATTNSAGQYALIVMGRSSPSDYAPLHVYIQQRLAEGSKAVD